MKSFTYNIEKIDGFSCPNKVLVSINDEYICFTNSLKMAGKVIKFAETLDETLINNGKIKKKIRNIIEQS